MSLNTRDLANLVVVVHKVFRMVLLGQACLFYLELCHANWFLGAPQFADLFLTCSSLLKYYFGFNIYCLKNNNNNN